MGHVLNIGGPTNSTYNATFETKGYKGLGMTSGTLGFQGYTQGPGYWGKTFYYWPPDPTKDWRSMYFTFTGGSPDNSRPGPPAAAGGAGRGIGSRPAVIRSTTRRS